MYNREVLKHKRAKLEPKAPCQERGKNITFRKGGGIMIVFGYKKNRPLRVINIELGIASIPTVYKNSANCIK
jgi:hypothetical protein